MELETWKLNEKFHQSLITKHKLNLVIPFFFLLNPGSTNKALESLITNSNSINYKLQIQEIATKCISIKYIKLPLVELRRSDRPLRYENNGRHSRLWRWNAKGGGKSRRWHRQYRCGGS